VQRAATGCPPREQRRHISDVHDLIEATWQYCQAEQWQEAYALMEQENIVEGLMVWGGNAILLELYQLLLPLDKWHPERAQEAEIYYYLGRIYYDLGDQQQALSYYEQALHIAREVGNRKDEGITLNSLGECYRALGNKQQALSYLEQALHIYREVGSRINEATVLNDLGLVYDKLGDRQQELSYFEQALHIYREVGSRKAEGGQYGILVGSTLI